MTNKNQWRTIPISKAAFERAARRHVRKDGTVNMEELAAELLGLDEDAYELVHKLAVARRPARKR